MFQKWDYKTVLSMQSGNSELLEIDAVPATRPKNFVSLFKELGQDGWELVAHSAILIPSPFESMTDEERTRVPLEEAGEIHPLRQPTMVYWWIFKRPVFSPAESAVNAPTVSRTTQLSQIAGDTLTEGRELIRRYQAGERNFQRATLSGAKLAEANLTKADLAESDLSGANLQDANLTKANLSDADLSGADFYQATLAKANLSGADLTGAMLWEAQLQGADLTDANLEGAHIEDKQLSRVASLEGAIMPDGRRYE